MLAEGTVHQPFTLIGRDDACDVTLADPDVNLRHAWLQVVGGRPFLIDLGSRAGLVWPTGGRPHGWLDVGVPVGIGPFQFLLRSAVSEHATTWPIGFNPLRADPETLGQYPAVGLEFRNGRRPRDRWPVNRMITLIGRSPDCKIHLNADDIAMYHCGLVLTAHGLWVVDLSGRGVVVDGERMRVAALRHTSELWVGRFLIACIYPSTGPTPAIAVPSPLQVTPATPMKTVRPHDRTGTMSLPTQPVLPALNGGSTSGLLSATSLLASAAAMGERNAKLANLLPEDEVPLGVQPAPGECGGLPSSHIMADAFETLKKALADRNAPTPTAGQNSGAISISGTLTPPPIDSRTGSRPGTRSAPKAAPIPAEHHPAAKPVEPHSPPSENTPTAIEFLLPILKQLGDVHSQMFEQFQQAMLLMAQMFGQLHRDQMSQMQQELLRIQELNAELAKLQTEVARLTMLQALGLAGGSKGTQGTDTPQPMPSPLPFNSTLTAHDSPAAMQTSVVERINALQVERHSRWQKLVGYLSAPPNGKPA